MSLRSFNVVMVCSGNLCRSPIAEQLFRARTVGQEITVSSAGVIAEDGLAMPEEAATISRQYGGDPRGHYSRLLTESLLGEADLVLTATREHRSAVVRLLPRMSRKTFTIKEFARLLCGLTDDARPSNASEIVNAARSLRGFVVPPENAEDDDVEDPYRRSFEVYESVGMQLDQQISYIAAVLFSQAPNDHVQKAWSSGR